MAGRNFSIQNRLARGVPYSIATTSNSRTTCCTKESHSSCSLVRRGGFGLLVHVNRLRLRRIGTLVNGAERHLPQLVLIASSERTELAGLLARLRVAGVL